jgi:uncharacterized phage-associated protein
MALTTILVVLSTTVCLSVFRRRVCNRELPSEIIESWNFQPVIKGLLRVIY